MKTALITGVSGYLGSHLAKTLKKAGWRVVGLDIKHTDNQYVDLFHPCDVRNAESLHILFDRVDIDVVFHLAGRIEVGESVKHPTVFFDHNTGGTNALVDVMRYWGVDKIVYSSTAGVYRSQDNQLAEWDAVDPMNNPYAASKYAAELVIKHSGIKHIIFRYFNLAGADSDNEMGECHNPETHLIPVILQNLNNFTVYGKDYNTFDGTCIRDFVHVEDVAQAHLSAAEHLLNDGESHTINLGTGEGYSIKEIIALVEKVTGNRVVFQFGDRRPGDPALLVANISFAKEVLQFEPKHDIISIIRTAYNWETRDDNEQ